MSTRVELNRPSASKANDLLKNLSSKPNEISDAQPFKKELAKAQRAGEKPKPEARAEEPQSKKPARAEKKSDAKAKKPAKPREYDADEQPVDEADAAEKAEKPEAVDSADDTTESAEADAEKPVEQPKVKTEAKADQQPVDASALAANALPKPVTAKDDQSDPAETAGKAAAGQPVQVKAVDAKDAEKSQAAETKVVAKTKQNADKGAEGKIDLSQLQDVADEDESSDADSEAPATPQAADAETDQRVEQATARPTAKVASAAPEPLAIQPVQQQANQQQSPSQQQMRDSDPTEQLADAMQMLADVSETPAEATSGGGSRAKVATQSSDGPDFASLMPKVPEATNTTKAAAPAPPAPPEVQFASNNHDKIITGLKSELLPNGGTMHIRLDPPELGALQVKVSMQDGVMTASFETSNDDATKMLSHSLSQLKHALESQGVSVDKLHVQQSPRNESSSNQRDENGQPQGQAENHRSAQQEQQRKEMIRRMWAKLGVIQDPLDMVA